MTSFSFSRIFCIALEIYRFSQLRRCAFDEILFCLRKLIGDERGSEYQLAFVCDFLSSPEILR